MKEIKMVDLQSQYLRIKNEIDSAIQEVLLSTVFIQVPQVKLFADAQKAYRQEGFGEGSFPVIEKLSKTVLSLPIHTEMTESELSYICQTIKEYNG